MERATLKPFVGQPVKILTVGGFIFNNIDFHFIDSEGDIIEFYDDKFGQMVTMNCKFIESLTLLRDKRLDDRRVK